MFVTAQKLSVCILNSLSVRGFKFKEPLSMEFVLHPQSYTLIEVQLRRWVDSIIKGPHTLKATPATGEAFEREQEGVICRVTINGELITIHLKHKDN